nr:hypothetical protein Iba_chr11eCG12380 [Ipomoea batatas]
MAPETENGKNYSPRMSTFNHLKPRNVPTTNQGTSQKAINVIEQEREGFDMLERGEKFDASREHIVLAGRSSSRVEQLRAETGAFALFLLKHSLRYTKTRAAWLNRTLSMTDRHPAGLPIVNMKVKMRHGAHKDLRSANRATRSRCVKTPHLAQSKFEGWAMLRRKCITSVIFIRRHCQILQTLDSCYVVSNSPKSNCMPSESSADVHCERLENITQSLSLRQMP